MKRKEQIGVINSDRAAKKKSRVDDDEVEGGDAEDEDGE